MKAVSAAALVVATITLAHSVQAQDNGAKPVPVEAYFCNFVPGKGMKDLAEVAQRFGKWADKHNDDYSAWILTPRLGQFEELPEVVWLGSNTSGDEMGKGVEAWTASGGKIQAEFDSVVACDSHSVVSSLEVNAPDGPPGDGVVMFTQCSIADGGDWMKAVAAHKAYSEAMRNMGGKNSSWMFFPMLGASADMNFDYWSVSTFGSWSDYFAAYEVYVNGGGWQKAAESLDGAASCNAGTPSVWDVKLVRQAAG